jgi:acyl-CoA thioesterase I
MDNQRASMLLRSGDNPVFDGAPAAIAPDTGAGPFFHDRLMRVQAEEGEPASEFIAVDDLHHNDRGYHCVARALARAMLAGLPGQALEVTAGR